ncbi:MAG: membrane dipeptidase [Bacteroidales bacterium]
MRNHPFIDIHVHSDLKTFLSANEERCRLDCWQKEPLTPLIRLIDKILLGSILESQSSLSQLNHSAGTIAIVGRYAFEKAMLKGNLVRILGIRINLLRIAKILNLRGQTGILNYELLKRISSWRYHYYDLFKEEEPHLLLSERISPGYKLLKRISDYDSEKLNVILTIEGGHNLFNKTFGFTYKRDALSNLRDLKFSNEHYLFMGLAHLSRNRLATHAYGMKLLHDRRFKPVGCGIRKLGRKVIKLALSKPNRILIDIKHLSLESRKQYYDILKTEYGQENIPIIASHTGVTGVSFNHMPVVKCKRRWRWKKVRYSKPDGLMDTKFNPWSINLYDEEIQIIIDSKGLIGLSLDERILGTNQKRKAQLNEYFSSREFSCPTHRCTLEQEMELEPETDFSPIGQRINSIKGSLITILREIDNNPKLFQDIENMLINHPQLLQDFVNLFDKIGEEYDHLQEEIGHISDNGIKHLCNNILHIVKVAGIKALKHISIGSDFDGFVDSIKECKNSTEYHKLAAGLKKWLPLMASTDSTLPDLNNIDQIVDNIMFRNAYKFLKINFT